MFKKMKLPKMEEGKKKKKGIKNKNRKMVKKEKVWETNIRKVE